MDYRKRKHNGFITTAIKGFLDKKSGKVSASRKEIKRRYFGLDWRYQKQILYAFMESGASDRIWAYRQLYADWDDCFIPVLQGLWEKYHEKQVSWLIIRFFPKEYLRREFDKLSEGRNYFFLCQRLADDKDIVVDRAKLSEADLLTMMYDSGETVTEDDVRYFFNLVIYKLCKGVYKFRVWKAIFYTGYNAQPLLAIFNHKAVRNMIAKIDSDVRRWSLSRKMEEWMLQVTNSFIQKYDDLEGYFHDEEEERIRNMIKEHCLQNIDSEFTGIWDTIDITNQQAFLDVLEARHKECITKERAIQMVESKIDYSILEKPTVRKLMDLLDLEKADSEPF